MEVFNSLTSKTFRAELGEFAIVSCCPQHGMLSKRSNAHRCKRERQDVCLRLNCIPITHMMISAGTIWGNFRALIPSFLPTFPLFFISSFFPFLPYLLLPCGAPGTEPNVCGDPAVGGLYERLAAVQDSDSWLVSSQHQAQSCSASVRGTELSPFQETMKIIESKGQWNLYIQCIHSFENRNHIGGRERSQE